MDTSKKGRGKQLFSAALSLSKNLCLEKKCSVSQGEYEGAAAPSCLIECLQKACDNRRLPREAGAFRTAKQAKKRGILKAVKKVHLDSFDSLRAEENHGFPRFVFIQLTRTLTTHLRQGSGPSTAIPGAWASSGQKAAKRSPVTRILSVGPW